MMSKHTEKFAVAINSIRLCISWTGLHHDQFTFYVYQESGGTKHGVPADAREFHINLDKKKSGARKQFTFQMLSQIPAMFEHHQIELGSICLFIYFLAPFRALSRLEAKLAIHNTHTHTHNCSNTNGYTILVYVICTTAGGKFVSK